MTQYAVNSQSLRDQSKSVLDAAADISARLSTVTGQIQQLQAEWTGTSSDAFQSLWQEWNSGAQKLLDSMDGIGSFLQQAASTFEDAEHSVAGGAGR